MFHHTESSADRNPTHREDAIMEVTTHLEALRGVIEGGDLTESDLLKLADELGVLAMDAKWQLGVLRFEGDSAYREWVAEANRALNHEIDERGSGVLVEDMAIHALMARYESASPQD